MLSQDLTKRSWRTVSTGIAIIGLGVVSAVSPLVAGAWALAILGILLLAAGGLVFLRAVRDGYQAGEEFDYVTSIIAVLMGLLFIARPVLVIGGLLILGALLLMGAGILQILSGLRHRGQGMIWELTAGVLSLVLGIIVWRQRATLGAAAIGLVLGLFLISLGWRMLLARRTFVQAEDGSFPASSHPDPLLKLEPHGEVERITRLIEESEERRAAIDRYWCFTLFVVFFAIHAGRMSVGWNRLGALSIGLAVAGDIATAILLSLLLLPARLLWRKATRPFERSAWQWRLARPKSRSQVPVGEWLVDTWLDRRVRLAVRMRSTRASFGVAVWQAIQLSLPAIAILIAINPIWGFSWYFNTENWVSGFWQKLTESRVDPWREKMVSGVMARRGISDISTSGAFEIMPEGIAGESDFSFLVIGDPGEGDPSQFSLKDQYVKLGARPDVKFLVISSDVIYPAGEMESYEFNFYMPFKGFEKPIYAIPGNHDWFDGLEGFVTNFFEPEDARQALGSRKDETFSLANIGEDRINRLLTSAATLRVQYHIRNGLQRAPFFEIQTERFAFIAADTGILKRLDPLERRWLEAALERSKTKFTFVLLGHPFYAGGHYQGTAVPEFKEIHDLLRRYNVPIVMAGDTHDFEYYREAPGHVAGSGGQAMTHIVTGGGGAYLSIGTALDWPEPAGTRDWAFYPATEGVKAKLEAETPVWKRPFWWWLKLVNAWPSSPEMLSGIFDFNRAPYFQSFMEVRVEGSRNQVRLLLYGTDGPLKWRDLQIGGDVVPPGESPYSPVEFVLPMQSSPPPYDGSSTGSVQQAR
jgi:uncharacterized membrane protein HdeD (DUF308 family)